MKYYLSIGEVIISVDLDETLLFADSWKIFFEEYLSNFLVEEQKIDFKVKFVGWKKNGVCLLKKRKIDYPYVVDDVLVVDQILNPSMFLYSLEKSIEDTLFKKGGLFFHSASFLKSDKVVLVTGESGSGKSTLINNIGPKCQILSDDSVILKLRKKGSLAIYPCPTNYKRKIMVENRSFVFGKALTVLKNKVFGMRKEEEKEAYMFLLNQMKSLVNNKDRVGLAMKIINIIAKDFFLLSYNSLEDNVFFLINEKL